MEKIKVIKDNQGGTLTIWFGNPSDEYICEETGDGVVLMKDRSGNVIGAEFLYSFESDENFSVETLISRAKSA